MTPKDQIWQALKTISYPGYSRDIVSFGLVQRVAECDGAATVSLAIGQLAPEIQSQIVGAVRAELAKHREIRDLRIEVGELATVGAQGGHAPTQIGRGAFRRVIAIGSGKGGVGKSTVAVNLAVALARNGLRVGLMDADAYGPNVPRMFGVQELPPARDGKIVPAQAHGVKLVSIGLMVDPSQPLIWRGPMTDKLIRQFLTDVDWGELDALVVDLPPGTGDIALSLIQHAQPDGAVVVVTPQQVAVDDARKAVGMFRKLNVDVLGVVENMSYFVCDECAKRHELFGSGGGERFAKEVGIPLLGQVPLQPFVSQGGDQGRPVALDDRSLAGAELRQVAAQVWQRLTRAPAAAPLEIVGAKIAA
jgi:ATP-binding protein involved in chromosome partitioning